MEVLTVVTFGATYVKHALVQ